MDSDCRRDVRSSDTLVFEEEQLSAPFYI